MHILLATPLYSQHYDSGHFWLRALNNLGHQVSIWDYRLDKVPPIFTRSPDFTLVLKGETIEPKSIPSPKAIYWPDALERTPGIEEVLKHYDKVFTPVRPTPGWMAWLPSGWDVDVHRDLKLKRKGTMYVGTCNSDYKRNMIESIKPDFVHGNNWDYGYLPPVYLHELVACANEAEILIDVHQSPTVGLNRKFFEMTSCGFTLVDKVPGVEEILGWGLANQVSFTNVDEAKELIRYYLEKPKEREEIWRLQREKIQDYTYRRAVEKILSYLR